MMGPVADAMSPVLPVMISVPHRWEVQVLHSTQWNAVFAPALAGLGVWKHQQVTTPPRRPEGQHHLVACGMTTGASQQYNLWSENRLLREREGASARTERILVHHSQMQSAKQEVDELGQEALGEGDVLHGKAAQHQTRCHVLQWPHRTLDKEKKCEVWWLKWQ